MTYRCSRHLKHNRYYNNNPNTSTKNLTKMKRTSMMSTKEDLISHFKYWVQVELTTEKKIKQFIQVNKVKNKKISIVKYLNLWCLTNLYSVRILQN